MAWAYPRVYPSRMPVDTPAYGTGLVVGLPRKQTWTREQNPRAALGPGMRDEIRRFARGAYALRMPWGLGCATKFDVLPGARIPCVCFARMPCAYGRATLSVWLIMDCNLSLHSEYCIFPCAGMPAYGRIVCHEVAKDYFLARNCVCETYVGVNYARM